MVSIVQRYIIYNQIIDVDGDEWLLQTVAEALDEADASAVRS